MSGNVRRSWTARRFAVVAVYAALWSCGTETTEPSPGVSLALNPANATVFQGSSTEVTATTTRSGGFTGDVTLTVTGVGAGITSTVSDEQTTGGVTTATVTIDVGAGVALGNSTLSVRASGTGVSDVSATFALTVAAAPAYTLNVGPPGLSIQQGNSGASIVTLVRTNFTAGVTLTLEGGPSGITGTFNPTPLTGAISMLIIAVDPNVAVGAYTLTVRGVAGGLADRTATLPLNVTAPPPFTLEVDPGTLTITKGQDDQASVTITRNNFTGAVGLVLANAPTGVTGVFDPAAPTGNSSTLTITVDNTATPGTYNLSIDGTAAAATTDGDGGVSNIAAVDQSVPLILTVVEPASYTLALNPAALSVHQGETGQTALAITRANFTGAVTLSLGGAPTGVTGAFDPAAPTGNASTLTVTVGAGVTPGAYNLTVDGSGTAGDQSAALTLTVTAAPSGFTLAMNPGTLTVQQGSGANSTIEITRFGGFSADVSLSVSGLPAGLTATLNPAVTGGNSSTLNLTAAANLPATTYNVMVSGSGGGAPDQSTGVGVTVTPSTGGGSIDFSACEVDERPVWLAVQDGVGPWTQVAGTGDTYNITINSAKGGVAWVTDDGFGLSNVAVHYVTQAEIAAGALQFCDVVGTKTVTGTIAGISPGEIAFVALGYSSIGAFFDGAFSLGGVPTGAYDLVAYKRNALGLNTTDRMILRRNLNIPDNGSVGTVDFGAAEAFAPATGTMTLVGPTGGESITLDMNYLTATGANSCTASPLYNSVAGGSTVFTANGAPANQQVNGDFHSMTAGAVTLDLNIRTVTESFKTMGNRTLTLGAPIPTPTVTTLAGPYLRLQSAVTLPAEYGSAASFAYFDEPNNDRTVSISASIAWVGGTNVSLSLPDFSGVTGWDNAWAPASGSPTSWFMSATGGPGTNVCTEGARSIYTVRPGSTP